MATLPGPLPPDGREALTALICPECEGAVSIRLHGRRVFFACRVGHAYSLAELVSGKEQVIEVGARSARWTQSHAWAAARSASRPGRPCAPIAIAREPVR